MRAVIAMLAPALLARLFMLIAVLIKLDSPEPMLSTRHRHDFNQRPSRNAG